MSQAAKSEVHVSSVSEIDEVYRRTVLLFQDSHSFYNSPEECNADHIEN
jgi:hypothetical protein